MSDCAHYFDERCSCKALEGVVGSVPRSVSIVLHTARSIKNDVMVQPATNRVPCAFGLLLVLRLIRGLRRLSHGYICACPEG